MISLIVPVYNAELYLEKCLTSIQNQTYRLFEVVLINDGSTDQSEEICRKYQNKDPRFRLISIPNGGASAARNVGLQEAKGEYIAFTDSDDWLDEDYLEYLWNGMQKTNTDIFFCDFKINGVVEHDWTDCVFTGSEAVCELVTGGCVNRTPNKLYKRSCVANILFPEGRSLCEDAAWSCQVLERAKTVGRGKEGKYNYRMVDDSITHQKRHSESQLCAFYRNKIERSLVLMRQYDLQPRYQKDLLKDCQECLTTILESGCNLELWDVFQTCKKITTKYKSVFEENDIEVATFYASAQDYRTCYKNFCNAIFFSIHQPISYKIVILKKWLLSKVRRMR